MKIGLFYGSTTCYTEMAAEKIRNIIGADLVDIHNVKETPLSLMAEKSPMNHFIGLFHYSISSVFTPLLLVVLVEQI